MSSGRVHTCYVSIDDGRDLIQKQYLGINMAKPLLQCASTMSNDLNDLVSELLVWGNLGIPNVDKVFQDDCNKSIKLKINLI